MNNESKVKVTVRLPDSLHKQLSEEAHQLRVPLAPFLVSMLTKSPLKKRRPALLELPHSCRELVRACTETARFAEDIAARLPPLKGSTFAGNPARAEAAAILLQRLGDWAYEKGLSAKAGDMNPEDACMHLTNIRHTLSRLKDAASELHLGRHPSIEEWLPWMKSAIEVVSPKSNAQNEACSSE